MLCGCSKSGAQIRVQSPKTMTLELPPNSRAQYQCLHQRSRHVGIDGNLRIWLRASTHLQG